ncbi:DsrC family protein [hydrothermal vent metagenome]|uniref:DsrC family protein n=1 Tax=hydrothermal vent metagenome TaxID=652676 RepID=A0A3B0ZK12_9ZZZZ
MTLEVNGATIAIDNEGYLLDPEDWNEDIAKHIAELENIDLNESAWQVVRMVRDHYFERQSVPETRIILKKLAAIMGKENATRKYLYNMFPYGYGQQACKIAGMRKPLKLMLDL